MELIDELQILITNLDKSIRVLKNNGIAHAEAERKYKEAVSKEMLKLRDEGVPVTFIDKVIYGLPSISTLRFDRDCKKVIYDANQEFINITKLEIKVVEAQISREWGNIND